MADERTVHDALADAGSVVGEAIDLMERAGLRCVVAYSVKELPPDAVGFGSNVSPPMAVLMVGSALQALGMSIVEPESVERVSESGPRGPEEMN